MTKKHFGETLVMRFSANIVFMLAPQRHGSNKTQSLLTTHNPSLFGPFPPVLGHWFLPLAEPLGDGLVEAMVATANLSPRPMSPSNDAAMSSADVREIMAKQGIPGTVLGIMSAIYRTGAVLMNRGNARVLCKSPDNLLLIHEIANCVEDATFVHLVRDPRGVWNSGRGTVRGPQTPYASAMAWKDYHSQVLALAGRLSLHTVRFEDLLSQPEVELRQICSFLRVPFEPSMLNAHESPEARWAAQSSHQLWGNLDKPIQTGRANAWERELPAHEVEIVEAVCADVMAEFGYARTLPARSMTQAQIDSKPAIEAQPEDADPRRLQLAYLRKLYREHNLLPEQQVGGAT